MFSHFYAIYEYLLMRSLLLRYKSYFLYHFNSRYVCSFTEAFEYITLDLTKVPGQGLGLSIVGRR